jgi:hypothetical protein
MARKKSQSLLTWLLWHPLKFALIAFGLIVLISAVLNAMGVSTDGPIAFGVIIAVVIAAAITFWYMPRGNMDRRGFIALNNAQTLIATTIFWASAIIIATYQAQITNKLLWMATMQSGMFFTIFVLVGVFYMYLFGVSLTNLYTKYQRCREMGISPWKIILSMPFGFGLLWTPGYLLDDGNKNNSSVTISARWYERLTNWIMSNPIYTTLAFALIVIYSGFFAGFNAALLTLASAVVFAIWLRIAGLSGFRGAQNRTYAYVAIVVNIAIIIGFILLATNNTMMTINITDIAPVNM